MPAPRWWVVGIAALSLLLGTAACDGGGGGGGIGISGTITYSVYSSGTFVISVFGQTSETPIGTASVAGSASATYSVAVPPDSGDVFVFAFNDTNGDGLWDPLSEAAGYAFVTVGASSLTGVNITLSGDATPTGTCLPSAPSGEGFWVVTVIPCDGATGVDRNSPILLFFDTLLDPLTINASSIQVAGTTSGTISGTRTPFQPTLTNFTFVAFVPQTPYAAGETVTVTIPFGGLKDSFGGDIAETFTSSFRVSSVSPGSASAPVTFESGGSLPAGVTCQGDCAVLSSFGDAPPAQGSYAAYISTGDNPPVVSSSDALGYTTSILTIHGVNPGSNTSLSFTYNFVSEEFNEFVNSIFDDIFLVAVIGPTGSMVQVIDSVNLAGLQSGPGNFPGLTDAYETGNKTGSVLIGTLGTPLTIMFIVSDVGDTILHTVVMIDNITFITP